MTGRNVFTNFSASNRAYNDTIDLITALDRYIAALPPYAQRDFRGALERLGAAKLTLTSLRTLAEELPFPATQETAE